jgi:hypothetical protein
MVRFTVGAVVLAASVVASSWLVGADEKKPDDPVKVKGTLPAHWRQLGLSADQVQEVYKIQAKYNAKIDKLKAEIEALKSEEDTERYKVLTDEQKKRLKELKIGEKDKDKDKDKDKGTDKGKEKDKDK